MTDFSESINFKKQVSLHVSNKTDITKPANQITKTTAKSDGFTFTTTNFDHARTSTVQEDWVQVILKY